MNAPHPPKGGQTPDNRAGVEDDERGHAPGTVGDSAEFEDDAEDGEVEPQDAGPEEDNNP